MRFSALSIGIIAALGSKLATAQVAKSAKTRWAHGLLAPGAHYLFQSLPTYLPHADLFLMLSAKSDKVSVTRAIAHVPLIQLLYCYEEETELIPWHVPFYRTPSKKKWTCWRRKSQTWKSKSLTWKRQSSMPLILTPTRKHTKNEKRIEKRLTNWTRHFVEPKDFNQTCAGIRGRFL